MKSVTGVLMSGLILPGVAFAEEAEARTGKAGYDNDTSFAGPGSTVAQLEEDDALVDDPAFRVPWIEESLDPWFAWKGKLQEDTGLQIGIAYTSLFQSASDSLPGADSSASSGILRFSGKWQLFGNQQEGNSGSLVFSADHRHRYGDQAPSDLGFSAGYLGIPGTLFSDADALLGDFYWAQGFNGGKTGLVIGRYDPNDFFDVSGYANPWSTFQNLSILFNASTALADWSTGVGFGHWVNDQWYVKAAVNDVNGTASDIKFFDDFDELYTTAEIGWSPSRGDRYFKNFHVTAWYADERVDEEVPQSEGISFGANWTWCEQFMLFGRAGWSSGEAPLYNQTVTAGMLYYVPKRTDLLGLAVNWGDPADSSLDEQWTGELFYRFRLAQNVAITPSIQVVLDPALNPDEDELVIGSIRTRFSF